MVVMWKVQGGEHSSVGMQVEPGKTKPQAVSTHKQPVCSPTPESALPAYGAQCIWYSWGY
jgi:hypothetical protein